MDKLQEQIARRAYELFQARGGEHGYHMADWFQAEKEILGSKATSTGHAKSAAKESTTAVKKTPTTAVRKKKAAVRV